MHRGETALDQGRFDDARATVERIRAALPEHPGAKALAQKIFPEAAPVVAAAREVLPLPEPDMRVARVETAPAAPTPPPKPKVDPLVEANKAFEEALAEGRLLTPAEQSAKHFVGEMNRIERRPRARQERPYGAVAGVPVARRAIDRSARPRSRRHLDRRSASAARRHG